VKPDNIYVLDGVYKLGDFGRATRIDGTMHIEEGDSRYTPLEILNDDHSQLHKADIFALGATIYELARGLPLPSSGVQFQALRQGKLALLPSFSVPFQILLKVVLNPLLLLKLYNSGKKHFF
jgi:wee1-like protein kinase